ncbi:equilibrative nucleoside transporter 1 [Belonocnema kinseyi]|uniref:equilibrative nucleoside transporter 1 n=1 Tax=Belonocnema kinseyi TaxID=2817044 RepID=UPI00143D386E|nr:equilibrative nucleoside transporter 1 [Belonocnema kinseyi]
MSYSINRQPLLRGISDSEFEDDIETEIEEPSISKQDEEPFIKPHEPTDRFQFAYLVFYLLGVTTLIPWCFFMTADEYWMYKFREIRNDSGNHNYTLADQLGNKTDLQASFMSYLSVCGAIPNTLFLIINAFISDKISLELRMIGSQGVVLIIFLVTTAFVKADTDHWQSLFLIITLSSVALMNMISAIFGGGLLGISGRFPPRYITAMSGGQALGGILAALADIFCLWLGASPVVSALLYFVIGDAILFFSLVSYIFLQKTDFFKYYTHVKTRHSSREQNYTVNGDVTFSHEHKFSYLRIAKRIWKYGLSLFLVFFVTMSVCPAVTVLVESKNRGHGHAWNDIYFVPVVTYLLFSCGDYAGRLISGIFLWPKGKPWLVMYMCILRVAFVPAFLYCNAQPRHNLPVYIDSDLFYIFMTIIFALTNGYLCNMIFILVPTVVDPQEREVASAMMGGFLGLGISFGSAVSLGLVKVL